MTGANSDQPLLERNAADRPISGTGGAGGRLLTSGYRAPLWLPGRQAQTIWPAILAPRAPVRYRRERWDTPDGDFIDLDHALPPESAARSAGLGSHRPLRTDRDARPPLLVLLHGLEGSSNSHYSRALMAAAVARGWRALVVHWRGCSGEPNRLPRAYHSGDSAELDWILRRLRPDFAIGVSLGGNVLCKWLGEQGHGAGLRGAVAIAPPQDLHAGAVRLASGFNRLYCLHFLRTLKAKSLALADRHPGLLDRERVARSRDFFDFDDCVTAPLHGFDSAMDYWQRSSCRRFLAGIGLPTLVINARNDPFLPESALARPAEVSPSVTLEYPRQGGHVGFSAGPFPGDGRWLADRALGFLAQAAGLSSDG